MKVYNHNPLGIESPPLDNWIIPLIILLLIVGIYVAVYGANPNPVSARLLKPTIRLSTNESTILHVFVTNPFPETQSNIPVNVDAPGSTKISIHPKTQTIDTLGSNESRKLEFAVVPIDEKTSPFLPGTYKIDVSVKMNNQTYQTRTFIEVEK